MKKIVIAGATAIVMVASGIGGTFIYKEHFEKARPYKMGGIEPPNMNKASRAFVANHPAPKNYCQGGVVLNYDDLNTALIQGKFATELCHEAKVINDPERDGICYISAVFEKNIEDNLGCVMSVIEADTIMKLGDTDEIEQSLRFLRRYLDTRETYQDLETYKQLNR